MENISRSSQATIKNQLAYLQVVESSSVLRLCVCTTSPWPQRLVPEEGEGAGWGVPTVHPPPLPLYEGWPEPHDRVLGWERMHMWVQKVGVTSMCLVRSKITLALDRCICWHGTFMYTYNTTCASFPCLPPSFLSPSSLYSSSPSSLYSSSPFLPSADPHCSPLVRSYLTGRAVWELTVPCACPWSIPLWTSWLDK